MTEQELIEKIADTYRSFSFWQDKRSRSVGEFEAKFDGCANQVLPFIKEAGYVRLSEDQSLPERSNQVLNACGQYLWGYSDGQSVLLKAGWRKVELEGEGGS